MSMAMYFSECCISTQSLTSEKVHSISHRVVPLRAFPSGGTFFLNVLITTVSNSRTKMQKVYHSKQHCYSLVETQSARTLNNSKGTWWAQTSTKVNSPLLYDLQICKHNHYIHMSEYISKTNWVMLQHGCALVKPHQLGCVFIMYF